VLGQAEPFPWHEQSQVPPAAAAVWHDGAEPCLAQSLPADGSGSRLPLCSRASLMSSRWGFGQLSPSSSWSSAGNPTPTSYAVYRAFPISTTVAFPAFLTKIF